MAATVVEGTRERRPGTFSAQRNTGPITGVARMAKTRSYGEHLDEALRDDEEALAYLSACSQRTLRSFYSHSATLRVRAK
jgi:hypothetical protein